MEWKTYPDEKPIDDKNYLVCWLHNNLKFSTPHKAYYCEEEDKFISLENNNAHPLVVNIYIEFPDPNKIFKKWREEALQ